MNITGAMLKFRFLNSRTSTMVLLIPLVKDRDTGTRPAMIASVKIKFDQTKSLVLVQKNLQRSHTKAASKSDVIHAQRSADVFADVPIFDQAVHQPERDDSRED